MHTRLLTLFIVLLAAQNAHATAVEPPVLTVDAAVGCYTVDVDTNDGVGMGHAAPLKLTTTLGPNHITYYEYRKGHTIPYHPRGILLPPTCPKGGFRFA